MRRTDDRRRRPPHVARRRRLRLPRRLLSAMRSTRRRGPHPMSAKRSEDVRPGDLLRFLSGWHRIVSTDERNAWGHPIARADDGWGITLLPGLTHEVA